MSQGIPPLPPGRVPLPLLLACQLEPEQWAGRPAPAARSRSGITHRPVPAAAPGVALSKSAHAAPQLDGGGHRLCKTALQFSPLLGVSGARSLHHSDVPALHHHAVPHRCLGRSSVFRSMAGATARARLSSSLVADPAGRRAPRARASPALVRLMPAYRRSWRPP